MRACRSVGSVLSLVLPVGIAAVTGCQTAPPPTPPPAPAPAPTVTGTSAADRQSLEVFPGTKTAAVVGALADPNPSMCKASLNVSARDAGGINLKDIVTYVDHQQNVIANGEVTYIDEAQGGAAPTLFNATYEPAKTPTGRAPREGDWALIRPRSR